MNEINPHLFTIATLTGHAALAYGPYTAVMDNGPAAHEGDLLRSIVKWSDAAWSVAQGPKQEFGQQFQ